MDDLPYRLLLHGIDTLQCAYYLYPADPGKLDFEELRVMKEDLRDAKVKEPAKVLLGRRTFLLHPFGTSSGYPFLMSDEDFKVEFGESNCRNSWEMLRLFNGRKGRANHEDNRDKNNPRGLHPLRPHSGGTA